MNPLGQSWKALVRAIRHMTANVYSGLGTDSEMLGHCSLACSSLGKPLEQQR